MIRPSRLHPIVDNLIVAQRALTRAMIQKDYPAREDSRAARDRAYDAVDEAFNAIEAAHDQAQKELVRTRSQVQNLGALVARLREKDPLFVSTEADKIALSIVDDQQVTEAFLVGLNEAVTAGYAVRVGETVKITSAGALALVRAAETRAQLDELRTKVFELEGSLRKSLGLNKLTPSLNGARRAVGA